MLSFGHIRAPQCKRMAVEPSGSRYPHWACEGISRAYQLNLSRRGKTHFVCRARDFKFRWSLSGMGGGQLQFPTMGENSSWDGAVSQALNLPTPGSVVPANPAYQFVGTSEGYQSVFSTNYWQCWTVCFPKNWETDLRASQC